MAITHQQAFSEINKVNNLRELNPEEVLKYKEKADNNFQLPSVATEEKKYLNMLQTKYSFQKKDITFFLKTMGELAGIQGGQILKDLSEMSSTEIASRIDGFKDLAKKLPEEIKNGNSDFIDSFPDDIKNQINNYLDTVSGDEIVPESLDDIVNQSIGGYEKFLQAYFVDTQRELGILLGRFSNDLLSKIVLSLNEGNNKEVLKFINDNVDVIHKMEEEKDPKKKEKLLLDLKKKGSSIKQIEENSVSSMEMLIATKKKDFVENCVHLETMQSLTQGINPRRINDMVVSLDPSKGVQGVGIIALESLFSIINDKVIQKQAGLQTATGIFTENVVKGQVKVEDEIMENLNSYNGKDVNEKYAIGLFTELVEQKEKLISLSAINKQDRLGMIYRARDTLRALSTNFFNRLTFVKALSPTDKSLEDRKKDLGFKEFKALKGIYSEFFKFDKEFDDAKKKIKKLKEIKKIVLQYGILNSKKEYQEQIESVIELKLKTYTDIVETSKTEAIETYDKESMANPDRLIKHKEVFDKKIELANKLYKQFPNRGFNDILVEINSELESIEGKTESINEKFQNIGSEISKAIHGLKDEEELNKRFKNILLEIVNNVEDMKRNKEHVNEQFYKILYEIQESQDEEVDVKEVRKNLNSIIVNIKKEVDNVEGNKVNININELNQFMIFDKKKLNGYKNELFDLKNYYTKGIKNRSRIELSEPNITIEKKVSQEDKLSSTRKFFNKFVFWDKNKDKMLDTDVFKEISEKDESKYSKERNAEKTFKYLENTVSNLNRGNLSTNNNLSYDDIFKSLVLSIEYKNGESQKIENYLKHNTGIEISNQQGLEEIEQLTVKGKKERVIELKELIKTDKDNTQLNSELEQLENHLDIYNQDLENIESSLLTQMEVLKSKIFIMNNNEDNKDLFIYKESQIALSNVIDLYVNLQNTFGTTPFNKNIKTLQERKRKSPTVYTEILKEFSENMELDNNIKYMTEALDLGEEDSKEACEQIITGYREVQIVQKQVFDYVPTTLLGKELKNTDPLGNERKALMKKLENMVVGTSLMSKRASSKYGYQPTMERGNPINAEYQEVMKIIREHREDKKSNPKNNKRIRERIRSQEDHYKGDDVQFISYAPFVQLIEAIDEMESLNDFGRKESYVNNIIKIFNNLLKNENFDIEFNKYEEDQKRLEQEKILEEIKEQNKNNPNSRFNKSSKPNQPLQ